MFAERCDWVPEGPIGGQAERVNWGWRPHSFQLSRDGHCHCWTTYQIYISHIIYSIIMLYERLFASWHYGSLISSRISTLYSKRFFAANHSGLATRRQETEGGDRWIERVQNIKGSQAFFYIRIIYVCGSWISRMSLKTWRLQGKTIVGFSKRRYTTLRWNYCEKKINCSRKRTNKSEKFEKGSSTFLKLNWTRFPPPPPLLFNDIC